MNRAWYLLPAIIILLGACLNWPYVYFQLLRWTVSLSSLYAAYESYQNTKKGWSILLGCIGILFNPLAPFYLNKQTWLIADTLAAFVLIIFLFIHRPTNDNQH